MLCHFHESFFKLRKKPSVEDRSMMFDEYKTINFEMHISRNVIFVVFQLDDRKIRIWGSGCYVCVECAHKLFRNVVKNVR